MWNIDLLHPFLTVIQLLNFLPPPQSSAQLAPIQVVAAMRDTVAGARIPSFDSSFYKLVGEDEWKFMGEMTAREATFYMEPGESNGAVYKVVLDIESYYNGMNLSSFYPNIEVIFQKQDEDSHIFPILVSPYCYSIYRGREDR